MKYKNHLIPLLILCTLFTCTTAYVIRKSVISPETKNIDDQSSSQNQDEIKGDTEKSDVPSRFNGIEVTTENIDIPVLQYITINNSNVSAENFKEQMQYIKDNGFTPITLDELYSYVKGESPIPKKSIVITIDNGFSSAYRNAYPILKDFNFPACIFVTTDFINSRDYLTKDQITEMMSNNILIESNSSKAVPQSSAMRNEVTSSKKKLEDITGKEINYFAYPMGTNVLQSKGNVEASGFKLSFNTSNKIYDKTVDPFNVDRICITGKDTLQDFINKIQP